MIVGGRVGEGLPDVARRHPRLRRAHRRAAMDVSHHSASRASSATRHGRRRHGVQRRREQLARHGARRGARHRLRPDGIGGGGFLRRRSARRQPVRELAARARRRDRQAPLALPVRAPRHLGSRFAVAAEPGHGPAERPDDRRRRAGDQARLRVSSSIARTASRCFRSSSGSSRRATCPARSRSATQPIPTKPKPFARQLLTEDLLTTPDAGGARVGARAVQDVPQRGPVRAARRRQADRRLPGIRRRRRVGRPGVRSAKPASTTSTPTTSRGPAGSRRIRPAAAAPARHPSTRASTTPTGLPAIANSWIRTAIPPPRRRGAR